jgi:hypothetical protein
MRKRTLMSLIVSAGLAITLVSAMAATKTQTPGDQGDKRKRDTERATLPRQSPFACDRLALDRQLASGISMSSDQPYVP